MVMTKNEILRAWEGAEDKEAQIQTLADRNFCTTEEIKDVLLEKLVVVEAPKPEKPKVEPRLKHALRRMEELFQAITTTERADDVPDRDWAEEFHDLWTEYYFMHWGDTE